MDNKIIKYSIYYNSILENKDEIDKNELDEININKYEENIKKAIPIELHKYTKSIECNNIYDLNLEYLKNINNSVLNKEIINNYEKPVIIFFSMIDYYFRIQRNQHMCRIMAERGYKVFYVRTRFNEEFLENNINENLIEINLNCNDDVSIYKSKLNKENINKLTKSINDLKKKYNFNFFISYIANPFWYQLLKYINNTAIVYDCIDYHDGFGNISEVIINCEKKLLNNYDRLIMSSPILGEKLDVKNYKLIRNGCDFEYFNNIELIKKNKKVICYYGAVSDWFDIDLMERVVEEFSDYTIYIIGFVYCNDTERTNRIKRLNKYKNVKLLGEIPYKELCFYLKYVTVGLIPFCINPLIDCCNPVKLYEMMSMGIPVVMTEMPDVLTLKNDELYYVSKTYDNFIENIKVALNENGEMKEKRIEFARNNSWDKRVDNFERIVINSTPLISIVLLCYNNWDLTEQCINSIFENVEYKNYELIIVNNNSSDNTKEKLKKYKKSNKVKVINNKENYGFAKGMNIGALYSSGDYLVLLNNDTYCMNEWLYPLIKPYLKDNNAGIISPTTNNCGNEVKQFLIFDDIDDLKIKAKYLQHNKLYKYYKNKVCPFFGPLIKKDLFYKIGMLDVNYGRGGWEDDDLQYKLQLYNKENNNYYSYGSFVYHQESATIGSYNVSTGDNKLYFEKKWDTIWEAPKYKYEDIRVLVKDEFIELINLIKNLEVFTQKKYLIDDKNKSEIIINEINSKTSIKYENFDEYFMLSKYKFNKKEWNLLEIYKVLYTKKYSKI